MDDKTKSILLQVAFKEAAASAATQGLFDTATVEERTTKFYEVLTNLHTSLDINPKAPGRSNYSGGSNAPKKSTTNDAGKSFEVDGIEWLDFRAAKDAGTVKPNFPDFKSVNGDSLWLVDRDGNPVAEAETLRKVADVAFA